jgi:hypothetical protein
MFVRAGDATLPTANFMDTTSAPVSGTTATQILTRNLLYALLRSMVCKDFR